ncbi:MAG: PSD1 and planctomycete cytochrome C domain-containing protein [Bryobacteraceae bacterium]
MSRLSPLLTAMAILVAPGTAFCQNNPLFERDIKPLFTANCWKCHGMEDRKAGLDLRTPPLIMQGGTSGPVIVKGSAGASLLYQKVAGGAMPPGKLLKLSKEQTDLIRDWINSGATASRSYGSLTKAEAPEITAKDREFWAFQKPLHPSPPAVSSSRVHGPIDQFVLAKLEEKKIGYAPRAERRTLIRRASLDLLGLPPSPKDVAAFESDPSPLAWEKLLDRLLASEHFGERWGRHWLDAAGYADVIGIDNNPTVIRTGEGKWRYRDYVVRALNADKPYNRFLTEQLAGDEMVDWRTAKTYTQETRDLLEATGFLRNAADDTDNDDLNLALIRTRVLELTIQNVTSNLLGMTVGCAQCHSHRYDPIPQLDYYRMMAIFTPVYNPQLWPQSKNRFLADVSETDRRAIDTHNKELETQLEPLRTQLAALRRPYESALLEKKLLAVPEPLRAETRSALSTAPAKRSEIEKYLAMKLGDLLKVPAEEVTGALSTGDQARAKPLQEAIQKIESQQQKYGKIQAVYDVGPASPAYFYRRGNIETPITEVQPGFLSVLTEPGKPVEIMNAKGSQTSGRRLAFAKWLTEPDTPASGLVARVAVNRMWQHLFGEGLVASVDNFGHSGTRPSHPELLDWLATEFVNSGWRLKPMIKMIMLSEAYMQASQRPDAAAVAAIDPGNTLLWRMRLRRLEAEAIRDEILTVSGKLDLTMGGASVPMDYRPDGMVTVSAKDLPTPSAQYRRSLYMFQRRNFNLTMLSVFDEPVMATNCVRRNTSAVVLQSLAMLNDETVLEQADAFADRVAETAGPEPAARVDTAFLIALGRKPSPEEKRWSLESLGRFTEAYGSGQKALAALCHTIFNMNEFLYVQ